MFVASFLKGSFKILFHIIVFFIISGITCLAMIAVMENFLKPSYGLNNLYLMVCSTAFFSLWTGLFYLILVFLSFRKKQKGRKHNKGYLKETI